jgi:hypothetical protein
MFSALTLSSRFPPEAVNFLRQYDTPPLAQDEALIWGGGSMAGVLVVPDDASPLLHVPTVSISSFILSIKKSGREGYQPLVTPLPPEPPFAFIRGVSPPFAFIAPPDLLLRPDVPVWRVRTDWWHPSTDMYSDYLKRIIEAEPLGVENIP